MRKRQLPISTQRVLDRLVSYGKKVPEGIEGLPPHSMIRLIRNRLHMTQAHLSKRTGIPQSHLAVIENGKKDIQLSTLRKILQALFCDLIVLPKFQKSPDEVLEERVKKTARKKVARVSGTMALEKQLPDDKMIHELIRAEETRLKNKLSSEIWEE